MPLYGPIRPVNANPAKIPQYHIRRPLRKAQTHLQARRPTTGRRRRTVRLRDLLGDVRILVDVQTNARIGPGEESSFLYIDQRYRLGLALVRAFVAGQVGSTQSDDEVIAFRRGNGRAGRQRAKQDGEGRRVSKRREAR